MDSKSVLNLVADISFPLRPSVVPMLFRLLSIQFFLALAVVLAMSVFINVIPAIEDDILSFANIVALLIVFQLIGFGLKVGLVSQWSFILYVLRPGMITVQRRVFQVEESQYNTERIETIDVKQSVIGLIFNYGDIVIYNPTWNRQLKL